MTEQKELTEGEQFLCEFFKEEGIKYIPQVNLGNLKDDTKSYRVADFYLPKYKTYIEFLGYWNVSIDHKNAYKEKIKIYSKNNISCVYLYPENLGIIKYSFYTRLRKELKKHNLRKELSWLKLKMIIDKKEYSIGFFVFWCLLLLLVQTDKKYEFYWQYTIVLSFLAILSIFRIVIYYYKHLYDKD